MSKEKEVTSGEQVLNAAKFLADTVVIPGASQIMEGKVGPGILYGAAGVAAKALLGPWVMLGVGLDSYSKSASGKHLWELFGSEKQAAPNKVVPHAPEPVE